MPELNEERSLTSMEDIKLRYGIGSSNCVTREKLDSPAPMEKKVELIQEEAPVVVVVEAEGSIRAQCMKLVERIEKREAEIYLKEKELEQRADTLVMVDSEREKLERDKAAAEMEKNVGLTRPFSY
jgi:hypothetical protein